MGFFFFFFSIGNKTMGLCLQQRAYSISSGVTGFLSFTCWTNSWQTQSSSDPNFDQKTKSFKISYWVQIKQPYLTILCFFFPLVCGLSSQYLNIFPRGSQRVFYPGPLFVGLPFCCLYFSFPPTVLYQELNQPLLPWKFLELWFPFTLSISSHTPWGSLGHLLIAYRSV
jgi:hypothetical protein